MELSIEQQLAVYTTEKKTLVIAGPGSGKTACLIERVRYLLEEKKVDPKKIFCITFTNMAAEEMRSRLGSQADECFIGTIHGLANKILLQSGISTFEAIEKENFNAFFTMLQENSEKLKYPEVEHLLVDELQDTSDDEYSFMRTILRPKNFWAVGDSRQCQPAGTKIRLRNNIYKNIEDCEIGDSVCWYSPQDAFACGASTKAWNAKEKKITKISSREFINDNLITITTENGLSSSYTPNHITFIKMNKTEYLHAVYLMCDENNRFRIGKIPIYCTNKSRTNPWRDKMYKEGCDRIWILDVFKTDLEARVLETKLSYKYQIPQTCWQLDKVKWTKENIDYIYEGLDTLSSAKKCLKEFNRDYNYPLLNKKDENIRKVHFAHNAVAEIYACNLMPKLMSCLVYDEHQSYKHYHYEKIVDVNFNYITEPIKVYSLKVEDETYVADEIITHNCIYGFKGANYEIFMGLTEDPYVEVYELRDCYRCGPEVIDFANSHIRRVNHIYRTPTKCIKPYGNTIVDEDEFSYQAVLATIRDINDYKNTTILCRSNAMVDDMLFFLKQNGIPAFTFKKAEKTFIELQEELKSDAVKVLTVHSAKGLEWDNVIVCQEVQPWNDEECRINYVAATRAKNYLLWLRPARKRRYGKNQKVSFKQQYMDSQMQEW